MIEVITAPAHLAGAKVVHVEADEQGVRWLRLDRPHPRGGMVSEAEADVHTRHMLPSVAEVFRALLGAAPEQPDVTRALGVVEALVSDLTRQANEAAPPAAVAPWPPSFGFHLAILALKDGLRVRRAGWNGKGMWLALTEGSERTVRDGKFSGAAAQLVDVERPETVRIGAHIDMRAADGSLVIGWLASQTDMLATDWEIAA